MNEYITTYFETKYHVLKFVGRFVSFPYITYANGDKHYGGQKVGNSVSIADYLQEGI